MKVCNSLWKKYALAYLYGNMYFKRVYFKIQSELNALVHMLSYMQL